ncbi:hypothetical protein BJ684DRAFT_18277 [Piptocephalis cylindrospora]|uniref:MSP domain-containing protein n=1 Tax=Piptocephalis cylindrospora TaxID=1907219 RepID=A0A4P9Y8H1_9FUNG|nr:hypothetical protein BJ684DRAFT_18277 [Piptocephalis cylindrospora]|eukprot:RKP15398.1 hypothetical protein BJ684DRAFT_18277 [Piptocephalis cylindrospora]
MTTVASPSSLRISPPDLTFSPSKTRSYTKVGRLTLSYPADAAGSNPVQHLGFKFKTNAPDRYSVKPVLGVLAPGAQVDVYVRCEGFGVHMGDRFLVQIATLTEEEAGSLNARTWRELGEDRLGSTFIPCVGGPDNVSVLLGQAHPGDNTASLPRRRASPRSEEDMASDEDLTTPTDSPDPLQDAGLIMAHREKGSKPKVPLLVVSCACLLLGFLVPTFHPFQLLSTD